MDLQGIAMSDHQNKKPPVRRNQHRRRTIYEEKLVAAGKVRSSGGISTLTAMGMSVREAVRFLGVCRSLIYEEIAAGRLRARKIGRRTIILVPDAEEYLLALPLAKANISPPNAIPLEMPASSKRPHSVEGCQRSSVRRSQQST